MCNRFPIHIPGHCPPPDARIDLGDECLVHGGPVNKNGSCDECEEILTNLIERVKRETGKELSRAEAGLVTIEPEDEAGPTPLKMEED